VLLYLDNKRTFQLGKCGQKSERELICNHLQALEKLWIRPNGFSFGSNSFMRLAKLTLAEQLFAAVLRGDRAAAGELIAGASVSDWTKFTLLVKKTGFARLVVDNCCEHRLIGQLHPECRAELIRFSMRETTDQRKSDSSFMRVLKGLAPYATPVVWIKGASLSRVDYAESHHRQYSDLDVVVHPRHWLDFYNDLKQLGYTRVFGSGFCNQYGVGPVDFISQLTLAPCSDLVPSSALTLEHTDWPLEHTDWPMIDVKISPYDRGIQCLGLEEFFADAVKHDLKGKEFWSPDAVDHLLICLHTLYKDRFSSWKTLFDVHTLATRVNQTPDGWAKLLAKCKQESLLSVAWAGLTMSVDRFQTKVPYAVLCQLSPLPQLDKFLIEFAVSPYFVWNATSLPMMLANALTAADGDRKFSILKQSFFPSRVFLTRYYANGNWRSNSALLLILHWLVLAVPGGLVRTLFGKWMWPWPKAVQQEAEQRFSPVPAASMSLKS